MVNDGKSETQEIITARTQMLLKFVSKEGLGSKFKTTYDKLVRALNLPRGAKDELGIVGDAGMEDERELSI